MPKINKTSFIVRGSLVFASALAMVESAFASSDPTTAVALAKAINFADANTAQLVATASLITLFVTAAGASIVISRIKKAKSA